MPAAEGVDVATAREMWRAGDLVIDVRSPQEYALGHVAGAVNVPIERLVTIVGDLAPGQIVTTCTYGRRARRAADLLAAAGRTAFAITGGTKAWQAAGLPIATGPEPGGRRERRWRRRPPGNG